MMTNNGEYDKLRQTEAIFAAQRRARTLEGWQIERRKEKILRVHHTAQRLLRSLKVIIPYVKLIVFPASWLRGRRDNDRFLSLIEGIAFLHQHQRTIGTDGDAEYITASIEDYAMAYDLAHQVFAQAGSDLAKPVADFKQRMQTELEKMARVAKQPPAEFVFTRRMVREALRLPDHIVKRTMRQLEELEYVQVQRAANGSSFRYRLCPEEIPACLDGLITPKDLETAWKNRDNRNRTGTR